MSNCAIIVAAGSGTRAGGDLPKQYQTIGTRTVLYHTLKVFVDHPAIDDIITVISDHHRGEFMRAVKGLEMSPPVIGGKTRQQSVFNGLKAARALEPAKVLIHDAARPFVSAELITRVLDELDNAPGVIPAIAVTDTINEVASGIVTARLDRARLKAVQTPQGFHFQTILAAHEKAAAEGNHEATDDSALVAPVRVVDGEISNIKLTTPQGMQRAKQDMGKANTSYEYRTGHGFDVHAFEDGDAVILCGVSVPHTQKLKGHSDADVAIHTLTDAILGAIADGDIGAHFPPSDPQWKGAASDIFLKRACQLVADRNGQITHCDITVICELPKLRPHIDAMRNSLANIMNLDADRISVKATTSEKLGFTGRGEGIAAMATATVRLPSDV